MNITDNRIDLANSFEKFKEGMGFAKYHAERGRAYTAYTIIEKYGKMLIKECTLPDNVESADPNDLRDINI